MSDALQQTLKGWATSPINAIDTNRQNLTAAQQRFVQALDPRGQNSPHVSIEQIVGALQTLERMRLSPIGAWRALRVTFLDHRRSNALLPQANVDRVVRAQFVQEDANRLETMAHPLQDPQAAHTTVFVVLAYIAPVLRSLSTRRWLDAQHPVLEFRGAFRIAI